MSKEVTVAEANEQFSAWVRNAEHGEPVVITRRGKPVAALVSAEDLEITLTPREKPPRDADRLALIRAVGDLKVHQERGKPQGARVRLEAGPSIAETISAERSGK